MKKNLLILFLLGLLTACQPTQAVPAAPSTTSGSIEQNPAPIHTPEASTPLDTLGYKLLVGDVVNEFNPIYFNDEIVYLADQSFDILYMISSEMLFELLPPHDELHTMKEIKDLNEIHEELYPGALMGEFVDRNELNRVGCYVPLGITTGDEVLCGFSIVFKNSEVSVLVLGTTLREGVNTPVQEGSGE